MTDDAGTRGRVEVIVNFTAGSAGNPDPCDVVRDRFAQHGVAATIHLARRGAQIVTLTRQALASHPDAVVAGGGDGTVNAVASTLLGTGVPLGVLPFGTLNHFAKDLGVPLETKAAVDNVCSGRVVGVDVGRVNGHVFLNNSSVGLYPRFVKRREVLRAELGLGKWPAAAWAALAILRRSPFVSVKLHVQDQEIARRTPLVFVGNNPYEVQGFRFGERRSLDSGELGVYVIDRTRRVGLLALALRALFGRPRRKDFESYRVQELEIGTRRPRIAVAVDGEVHQMSTPLSYRIDKQALPVIVPRIP